MTVAPEARIGSNDALPRGQHGGRPVGGVRQRLPEPRHVEQGVIRGRADHQDGQDALALAVELDPAELGHAEHQQDGGTQGEDRGQQDGDGQEERTVDDQEDHKDSPECHEQQDAVDAGEGADQVRGQAGGSRDEGLHAFRRGIRQEVPKLLDRLLDLAGGPDGGDELHGLAVLGRDGADHRAAQFQPLQPGFQGRQPRPAPPG